MLLEAGADTTVTENMGKKTALHKACFKGDLAITKMLIEEGKADINALEKQGKTPLHLAL